MAYSTFSLLIADGDFSKWIDVLAIDVAAAKADTIAAFGDVRIVQWSVR